MLELPLIKAALKGKQENIRELLAAGHDVNECGEPLTKEELKRLRWLLNEAGVQEAAGAAGRIFDYTPLMAAIEECHFQLADFLLGAGADINASDSLGRTPLMMAIRLNHREFAKRLIGSGADLDAKDACGDPVLTQAIEKHAWEIVYRLLDAGANPDPKAKTNSIPLVAITYASDPEAEDVMKRLLDLGAKPRNSIPLAKAAAAGDMVLIRRLVELGSPLNGTFWLDDPLIQAAIHANHEATRHLLEQGAKLLQKPDDKGILCYVASGGEDEDEAIRTAEALLAAGANINHADKDGYTALHRTAEHARLKFARWLLERGANPNRCQYGEQTPLDMAKFEMDMASKNLERVTRKGLGDPDRIEEWRRDIELMPQVIALLCEFGGRSADDSMRSAQNNPVLTSSPPERRGLCDTTFFKARQIMIRADIDKIIGLLEKDRKFDRVERDVFSRLQELDPPVGEVLALIKMRGQSWVYLAGFRTPRGDSPMEAWSKKLRSPVLYAGEESVSSVVFYALYDGGRCVEAFESDGVWFHGGVEIDPEIQEESDRMHGTTFSSVLRDDEKIDWSDYQSEWEFLDRFLRDQDAYLTFLWAGIEGADKRLRITSYNEDEATPENIERVDLAFYKPTAAQKRAAEQKPPEVDQLLQAIQDGDVQSAKEAITAGAIVGQLPQQRNESYLLLAIQYGPYQQTEEIIDLLLAAGADPDFGGDEPVLPRAVQFGGTSIQQMSTVVKLLNAGADVNVRKSDKTQNPFLPGGQTALIKASISCNLNYARLLLKSGADVRIVDDTGKTALEYAEHRLREAKKDQLKDVPAFTDETHISSAQAVVELLESAVEGRLDIASLPEPEELIKSEEKRIAAKRKREQS